jgi:iron complex transport system substrate-binding protein
LIRLRQFFLFSLLLLSSQAVAYRELTDELGRHVTVPEHPQRIICLAPSITETVYALGAGEAVVGISDYTEFPAEALAKPSVGDLINPSVEKILDLHPDLVLASIEVNRRETVEHLQELGIPVFVVNPKGLDGIVSSIGHLGNAIDHVADAGALMKRLEEKRKSIKAKVQGQPRPSVFVVIWYDPVITIGNKAFITEVISEAGGRSATADISQAWPQISLEEVLRRSPDIILLTSGPRHAITIAELNGQAGWNRLEAIRENRVISLDYRLLHSSFLVFDAMEELAKKLHPSAFRQAERAQ